MWALYVLKNNIFFFVVFTYFLYEDSCKEILAYSLNDTPLSSSVFCSNHKNNSKRCVFLNLCYNFHSDFIFLLTGKSIISGLNHKKDFKNIFPTSVLNHSALPLKISLTYAKNFSDFKIYEKEVFLLHRFKPDNIMHVVHDDILPLFATYRDLCLGNVSVCASKYDILFSDRNNDGPYLEWYRAFSKTEPFKLSNLNKSLTHCFTKVNVGLSIDSVIFQYGFLQNRGPTVLSVNQVQLLDQFKTFMYTHFGINNNYQINNVVFLARKVNRKILNEEYVENIILKTFKRDFDTSVRLLNVDLSINSSKEVLQAIAEASYLIGMHGSGMFLSLFLPENSVAIEMFPYGIYKELVSPLFVMSSIPGIWFRYFSWENVVLLNSFPHPEYSSILGGLTHLERVKQIDIFGKTANISKECCNDPLFLSRMYQDTIVDDSLMKIISYSLKTQTKHSFDFSQIYIFEWFFPSVVQNITCYRNVSNLILSWNHPFNVEWSNNIYYDLSIQMSRHNLSIYTSNSFLNLQMDSDISTVKIWIKCNLPGIEGLDTFITC
ncbi:protein O-linked-mannose beta-1,4-N-acetylglucosaminyltransferase 2 [Halyomorpha halys]|uniref:protein O-linked-mannose beta-1,4-N-acetylglucosaminyltransferase 2 n=1 Tax=Halyomorpha halys TaxID=286706 RepID=UPI0006D5104D|nr:protein O-linked-mannose beta-1,4-N-acetylglucosaminyltransferase 2-like [Halyomorpha halys]XP_014278174.1 protein O-linked-mannose beta-1,4-N-acetylglucosaminyltransferase 2-like [Halyomorpha halys]XP_014278175.1 protein O-linked-mannose beta-1,4-N-acetylglucosaminyltransferase 2-like [Halyomorpha halys]XP_014278177.1 protein O-linked-mannose beta-1,4-N-acetylglucosaminyltransferase 2-like [Halyomorpha halys]XP_014278178.1 protein O-linked-mannose beta-1,4-N-acetylglucosaminyltransferase 2-